VIFKTITYLFLTTITKLALNLSDPIILFRIGDWGGANLCTYHSDNVKATAIIHGLLKKTGYMRHYINETHIHNSYLNTKGQLLYSFDLSYGTH
jgi:hypothetical protein